MATRGDPARSPRLATFPRARVVIGLALASSAAAHLTCGAPAESDEAYRLLDRTCEQPLSEGPACELDGAEKIEGITADTRGFRLGPSGSDTLTLHLAAIDSIQGADKGTFDIEVLVARTPGAERGDLTATFSRDCTPAPDCQVPPTTLTVEAEYRWLPVITDQPSPAAFPYSATLALTGTSADIADIRTVSLEPAGCSVAASPGLSR